MKMQSHIKETKDELAKQRKKCRGLEEKENEKITLKIFMERSYCQK